MKLTLNKYHLFLIPLIMALMACEEVIQIDLPNPDGKLVIDGEINSGLPAIVNLSYNMGYFDPIDSASLTNMFITDSNALVIVSDGTLFDTLVVMSIPKFPYTAYVGTQIIGEYEKTYTLNVSYEDKNYYATTSIPSPVDFSSFWFIPNNDNDSIGMIGYSFFDNGAENNYYYATSLTIGKQWWYYAPIYGVPIFEDVFFNGDSVIVQMPKGYTGNDFFQPDMSTTEKRDSLIYFALGESVSLRLGSMDQDLYLWWNSYYRSQFTGSNPYSNPSAVSTNIMGDPALGRWGGYANTIANVTITDSGTVEPLSINDLLPMILPEEIMDIINNNTSL